MDKRFFCTYFDSNYYPYALALSKSLEQNIKDYVLYIVCMDETCEKILNKTPLPNSILYSHEALKSFKPALKLLQIERTTAEYFFTCSAQVCEFIMRRNPNIDILNYIDVDLCFFSSPEPIFRELGTSSIGIIEHNFHWTAQAKKKYGIYNVGWISFRNDEIGLKCISDWAEDCVNWCYQRVENDLYADQKYLDLWSKKYKGLKVIKNKGANLAIWNIKNYKIGYNKNHVYIDGTKLIFYHFAGLKQLSKNKFDTKLSSYYVFLSKTIKKHIYTPYLQELLKYQSNKMISHKKEMKRSNLLSLIRLQLLRFRSNIFSDIIEIKNT
ncbi:hypothetical protein N9392_00455 [Flavobacteriaceae bacterium]|jgi:hypothetical protein|nr:hypothetical protein [Flavobacteriaceae bacterium]